MDCPLWDRTLQLCLDLPLAFIPALVVVGHIYLCVCVHSVVQSCLTLPDPMDCTLSSSSAHGISRQEYWSGLPFPPPGDLPNPGIKPMSPALQADSLLLNHWGSSYSPMISVQTPASLVGTLRGPLRTSDVNITNSGLYVNGR